MNGREPRVQPPALDTYSDLPLFNTKAVVHQTGVPAPTLRAWERRYSILAPRRGENDYRLYSERDMKMVTWLRERVESGMTISQAIALLRSVEPLRRRGRRGRAVPATVPEIRQQVPTPSAPNLLSFHELSAALLRHFTALDEFAAVRTMAQALAIYPVEDVCLQLLTPTLYEVGHRWASGEVSVTVEHFAATIVRAQLAGLFRSAAMAEVGPFVLVGCAPGELHEIGALMLALFLRRAGVRVAYLGQSVEPAHLVSTVAAMKPAGVLLSATMRPHAEALVPLGERLAETGMPQSLFIVGGQAFQEDQALAHAVRGRSFGTDALAAVDEMKVGLLA